MQAKGSEWEKKHSVASPAMAEVTLSDKKEWEFCQRINVTS